MPRNLGGLERPKDKRDILLGSVQAPVKIPDSYIPDISWLKRNYQGETAFCGEHAGAHLKAILDFINLTAGPVRKSPRYGAIKLKDPKSPLYDGYGVNDGTTMTAIFKWLQKAGAADFEPLADDVSLPLAQYVNPAAVTPDIDANAAQSKILSYAFGKTDFHSLCQAVYQNKAVLILIKCDDGLWGTTLPTFTKPEYGHFIVAYGYDSEYLYVVDSADPDDNFAFKKIALKYITPKFFLEAGTALDVPPEQLVNQAVQTAATVVQSNDPPALKVSLLTAILNFLQSLLPKVGSSSPTMNTKPWYQSKTVWFNGITILVTVAAFFGYTPDQNLVATIGALLTGASPVINLVLRLFTKQPIASPATTLQQ